MSNKPIREWLEELPEPYREQALHNVEEYGNRELYNIDTAAPVDNMSTALMCAFFFAESPEGSTYWIDFINKTLPTLQ